MIAKASVYLDAEGKPVPEGDKNAKSLLVREGCEIPDTQLAKYEGAAEIAGGTKAAPKGDAVQHRKPEVENRDPVTDSVVSHKKK
jgi:hypothetical protein